MYIAEQNLVPLELLPVEPVVLAESHVYELPGRANTDMFDRCIAAATVEEGAVLLTSGACLQAAPIVHTAW